MFDPKSTREERLAAKLRENLRLRKAQARAMKSDEAAIANPGHANDGLSKDGVER
jgi:hypothetical protein